MNMPVTNLRLNMGPTFANDTAKNSRLPSWPPPNDFPVVVAEDGKVVSRFGDSVWDLGAWHTSTRNLNFGDGPTRRGTAKVSPNNADTFRCVAAWWLWGPRAVASIGTLIAQHVAIKNVFSVCTDEGIDARDLSRYPGVVDRLARTVAASRGTYLLGLLHRLYEQREQLNFVLLDADALRRLATNLPAPPNGHQTAYIPPRIWRYQVARLREVLDAFNTNKEKIGACYWAALDAYAAVFGSYAAARDKVKDIRHTRLPGSFGGLARDFGIHQLLTDWYSDEKAGTDVSLYNFGNFLTLVNRAGLAYLLNYSLMRIGEAWSLRTDCLRIEQDEKLGAIHMLCGETTKTIADDDARWVTSPAVKEAIDAMATIGGWRIKLKEAYGDIKQRVAADQPPHHLMQPACEPWSQLARQEMTASQRNYYESVRARLGADHALLTRPVLVKRLVDIAGASASLESFIDQIQVSGADFFSVFVRGIIEREAHDKWIDRSGELATALLTVDEHIELLAHVALAMWDARVDSLKRDLLEFESDLYCEVKRKSAQQSQQIRERLRGHALLVTSSNTTNAVEFDHDEFRLFFLGEGLANVLKNDSERAKAEALSALRRGVLPEHSLLSLLRALKRNPTLDQIATAQRLIDIAALDGQASYTQENCGALILRLLSDVDGQGLKIDGLAFGGDALRDRKLTGLEFRNCYFSQSSLENATLTNCLFKGCTFGQLRLFGSTEFADVTLQDCQVESLRLDDTGLEIWEPTSVRFKLHSLGISLGDSGELFDSATTKLHLDDDLASVDKILRYFMRSTHISESVIKMKLGDRGQGFLDRTLPSLIDARVLEEIENRGGGNQRRFRLGLSLGQLNSSIATSQGDFQRFIESLGPNK